MKQQRRHELKTNDLSVYLKEIYEAIQRNSRYVVGGIVVVVMVLVILLVVKRNRAAAVIAAETTYEEVLSGDLTADPTLLDKARELAEQYGDDRRLGPKMLSLRGNMLYTSALSLTAPDQKADRVERLEQARAVFNDLLQRFGTRQNVEAKARMMLAKIEESLIVEGKGNVDIVRTIYQELKNSETGLYATQAEQRLASLDERLTPLKIVEAPATKPAPAEEPTTAPAADAPTTAPATAPAS